MSEIQLQAEVQVRNAAKREVDMRIMPWDITINTIDGPEVFVRGAFEGTDPSKVKLMGLEHEAHFGLGQDGRPTITRRPMGKALTLDDRPDGQYATFRVSNTASGDEYLALAIDGVVDGVSVEVASVPDGTTIETRNGRRTQVVRRADLRAVAPTYRPAYDEARVLAVRSEEEKPVTKEEPTPPEPKEPDEPEVPQVRARAEMTLMGDFADRIEKSLGKATDAFEAASERARMNFAVPTEPEKQGPKFGEWIQAVVKSYAGEPVSEDIFRAVADVKTTDNVGVVPPTYLQRIIGVIDATRPFIESVVRLETPESGTQIIVPKITQRPTVATQATEKTEVSSQKSIIGTVAFDMMTKAGVGDLSLQLLRRSSPSFLELWLRLLGEAYAQETEDEAVDQLIAAIADGGPEPATALDFNNLTLGAAFQNSQDAMRRPPDTIWLSTEALGEAIDAKATGTNAPLYSNLTSNFTAGGGAGGTISGLRPVHVPALDTKGAYAIVGPSSGFAFAEDGTFTLETVIASKLGRDVALAGFSWYIPWYPTAFTLYNVAS